MTLPLETGMEMATPTSEDIERIISSFLQRIDLIAQRIAAIPELQGLSPLQARLQQILLLGCENLRVLRASRTSFVGISGQDPRMKLLLANDLLSTLLAPLWQQHQRDPDHYKQYFSSSSSLEDPEDHLHFFEFEPENDLAPPLSPFESPEAFAEKKSKIFSLPNPDPVQVGPPGPGLLPDSLNIPLFISYGPKVRIIFKIMSFATLCGHLDFVKKCLANPLARMLDPSRVLLCNSLLGRPGLTHFEGLNPDSLSLPMKYTEFFRHRQYVIRELTLEGHQSPEATVERIRHLLMKHAHSMVEEAKITFPLPLLQSGLRLVVTPDWQSAEIRLEPHLQYLDGMVLAEEYPEALSTRKEAVLEILRSQTPAPRPWWKATPKDQANWSLSASSTTGQASGQEAFELSAAVQTEFPQFHLQLRQTKQACVLSQFSSETLALYEIFIQEISMWTSKGFSIPCQVSPSDPQALASTMVHHLLRYYTEIKAVLTKPSFKTVVGNRLLPRATEIHSQIATFEKSNSLANLFRPETFHEVVALPFGVALYTECASTAFGFSSFIANEKGVGDMLSILPLMITPLGHPLSSTSDPVSKQMLALGDQSIEVYHAALQRTEMAQLHDSLFRNLFTFSLSMTASELFPKLDQWREQAESGQLTSETFRPLLGAKLQEIGDLAVAHLIHLVDRFCFGSLIPVLEQAGHAQLGHLSLCNAESVLLMRSHLPGIVTPATETQYCRSLLRHLQE